MRFRGRSDPKFRPLDLRNSRNLRIKTLPISGSTTRAWSRGLPCRLPPPESVKSVKSVDRPAPLPELLDP